MRTRTTGLLVPFALVAPFTIAAQSDTAPDEIMTKVGQYVAAYGEKTSAIVGVEKYSQLVTFDGAEPLPPRRLVAEFAVVRAGHGWSGYRDVIEIDGRKVPDRKDRLERLVTEMTGSEADFARIAAENARYNMGPISRNLNVPTVALFFFQPANLGRFTFTKKGTRKIDGIETVEVEFRETQRPTLVMRRNGADVPLAGSLWAAADGTVVRTRLRLKNFGDALAMPAQEAPRMGSPVTERPRTVRPTPGVRPGTELDQLDSRELETHADIEVTYKKDAALGLWLPSEMVEQYQGPLYDSKRLVTAGPRRAPGIRTSGVSVPAHRSRSECLCCVTSVNSSRVGTSSTWRSP